MATTPKFRIDVDIHSLLMDSSRQPVKAAAVNRARTGLCGGC